MVDVYFRAKLEREAETISRFYISTPPTLVFSSRTLAINYSRLNKIQLTRYAQRIIDDATNLNTASP